MLSNEHLGAGGLATTYKVPTTAYARGGPRTCVWWPRCDPPSSHFGPPISSRPLRMAKWVGWPPSLLLPHA